MDSKPFYQSRTFWVNAVMGLAALYPPAQAFISEHPEAIVGVISVVNLILRAVTKGAVTIA